MGESIHNIPAVMCPACGACISPPAGTKIPSLPDAVYQPCASCKKDLVLYLDLSGDKPAIKATGITLIKTMGITLNKGERRG